MVITFTGVEYVTAGMSLTNAILSDKDCVTTLAGDSGYSKQAAAECGRS